MDETTQIVHALYVPYDLIKLLFSISILTIFFLLNNYLSFRYVRDGRNGTQHRKGYKNKNEI